MKKKIVFLPYDFDTAIGINNEGALVFGYSLEDIDTVDGGADVFNGQQSVLWQNMRAVFFDDIKSMYQDLRSKGLLSYEVVERMFEEHQNKWPEAIYNEDAWFKYLAPLVESGSAAYLSMLQGSKAEQRKWWLYNRFKYLDSKYNAGDALTDVITVRGYAKSNITITPYADVYTSVKYGSYLVQERATRNTEHTLACPLDNVNDTEIYIYSASQLKDIGDLSGLKVGYGEFSMGTKLQRLKIGDASPDYSNGNLTELHLGNNVLLKVLDVRNCPNLKQAVDISGCANIEEVYFTGTNITGLLLPNGGILKKLQLPESITNLTIRNQTAITDFSIPSYQNISTLRLENVNNVIDSKAILKAIPDSSRVRIIGFTWNFENTNEVDTLLTKLDTMRGLDENGNNVDTAQVSGVIHVPNVTGEWIANVKERYPYLKFTYDHLTSQLFYYSYDGSQLLYTETIVDAGDGTYSGTPTRSSTAQYNFTFAGWATTPNGSVNSNARKKVEANRSVYAAYTNSVRYYTVYFYNGNTLLQTVSNVPYGGSANYTGTTPVSPDGNASEYPFEGWSPAATNIQGNTSCKAVFGSPLEVKEIEDSWETIIANVNNGTYKTKYKVGNYKALDLGSEGVVNMQIAAKDAEPLADGSGNAPLSFVSMELLNTSHRMNPSLVGKVSPITFNPGTEYEWKTVEDIANKYESTNTGKGSTTSMGAWLIKSNTSGKLTITYTQSGESGYDYLTLYVKGKLVFNGKSAGQEHTNKYEIDLKANTEISVLATYRKDGGGDRGDDKAIITFSADTQIEISTPTEPISTELVPAIEGTGSIGGWEKSEMRSYFKNTIKPLIPEAVRNAIKEVTKYTNIYNTNESSVNNVETTDDVWIPSYREMFGYTETKGTRYKALFPDDTSRQKKKVGASSTSWWWLRSASSTSSFYGVGSSGNYSSNIAGNSYAVVLGFCI